MRDARRLPDGIDAEPDIVAHTLRLDLKPFGVAAGLATDDVGHRNDGLEGVPLRAPGRANMRLAAGRAAGVIEGGRDGCGWEAGAVIRHLDGAALGVDGEADFRGDAVLFAVVGAVVSEFLSDDQRPLLHRVP